MGKTIAAFVVPMLVGRGVEVLLSTPLGSRLADALRSPTLATPEGRKVVRKYSAAAAAIAVGASVTLRGRLDGATPARRDRLESLGLVAEMLLSAGALAKIATDYIKDQREVQRRHALRA